MAIFQSVTGANLDPGIEFVESVQLILRATDGDPRSLDELGDLLTKDVGSERVRTVVDADLKARMGQFANRLDERFTGSQWLRLLVTPVGQLPYDALTWSWNQAGPRQAGPPPATREDDDSDGIHFTLGGSPGPGAIVGRTLENDLQYCFDVLLSAAGQLRTPFSFNTMSADGSRALLDFRFEHPPQVLLQDALANDLPRLAHLLEPDQLPDSNLKSIELDIEGEVLLGAATGTATSWSTLRDASGEALDAPQCMAAGLRYDLEWVFPGHFKLQLKPDNLHGRVTATLIQTGDTEAARVLEFGSNLTSRGLERVIRPLLQRHSQAPADLIELADRYSRPREQLQEHLEQTLNAHASLTQELREMLSASGDARHTTQAFAEQVSVDAVSLIDQRTELWQPLLQGDPALAVAHVLAPMRLSEDRRRLARGVLGQWFDLASAALRAELCEELEELLDDDDDSSVLKALGGGEGVKVNEQLVKRLLAPAIEFISRVRSARQRLLDAAQASTAITLGLELANATRRDRSEQVLLEISMNPRNEEARRIYEQILTGDFRDAVTRALDAGQPHVTLERGLLAETLADERNTTLCFEVSADDHGLDLLDDEMQVEHVAGGAIRIGSPATWDSAPVASTLCLADPLALLVDDDAVLLAVALRGLTHSALRAHSAVLEDAGLVAKQATSKALDSLGLDDLNHLRADIVCALSRREIERVTIEEQLRIVDACLPGERSLIMMLDELQGGKGIDFVHSQVGASLHQVREALDAGSSSSPATPSRSLAELVHAIATNAERMQAYLGILRSLSAMELGRMHRGSSVPENALIQLESLRDEIDELAKGWAVRQDALPYWDYAFLTSLRRLAGVDRTRHPLTPNMRWIAHGRQHHQLIV